MKIICIGRNYADHAAELNNAVPTEPVIFCKPDSSLLPKNQDFYLPEFSNDVHHELEIVIKISKQGKYIQEKFASKYFDSITVGLDLTARDLQSKLKEKGLPWEKAKGFDGSAIVGNFISADSLKEKKSTSFSLLKNGEIVQKGDTSMMLFSISKIIEEVSKYFTLKQGDLIFTGTPAGVGPLHTGDLLEGYLEDDKLLEVGVK